MAKAASYTHPLDPLAASDIEACGRACEIYAADADLDNLRFNLISLKVQSNIVQRDLVHGRFQAAASAWAKEMPCSIMP